MASQPSEAFYKLLRNALFGTEVTDWEPLTDAQWHELMAMAKQQTVRGLIANAISRLPAEWQPPRDLYARMTQISMRILMSHQLLDQTLAELAGLYADNGIHAVVLKGQGVARYYPEPHLRECGDIDVYVGPEQYRTACRVAHEAMADDKSQWVENPIHYEFRHKGVSIEIHRKAARLFMPVVARRFQRWIIAELSDARRCRRIDVNGRQVLTPSADFDAVYIFVHAWTHLMFSGIGYRQLCDWAMVLHRNRELIDRQRLEHTVRRMHLMGPWQALGYVVVHYLGLPADEMPFYDTRAAKTAPMLIDKIESGGNFGFYDPKSPFYNGKVSFVRRKLRSIRCMLANYMSVVGIAPMMMTCNYIHFMGGAAVNSIKQIFNKHH